MQKINKGVEAGSRAGIKRLAVGLLIGVSLIPLSLMEKSKSDEIHFRTRCITGPIIEEVIFRGLFQNGIRLIQNMTKECIPSCLANNRIINWLTSPSARIITVGSLFALAHLSNDYDLENTLMQISSIALLPVESIIYETTGSIIAPIFSHITHNTAVNIPNLIRRYIFQS